MAEKKPFVSLNAVRIANTQVRTGNVVVSGNVVISGSRLAHSPSESRSKTDSSKAPAKSK
ncbi:hypothetical protein [Rhizobacter sp. Root16D2]|uniref:hypothetical protein n=1 Tax=Rhizobacter sp. Root16D2 TaxID=1736479 RepID=UPI000B1C45A5|nr:hypothetical protein [Rhizobacter sp. Root16D2]